jgi:hypothetical protein
VFTLLSTQSGRSIVNGLWQQAFLQFAEVLIFAMGGRSPFIANGALRYIGITLGGFKLINPRMHIYEESVHFDEFLISRTPALSGC